MRELVAYLRQLHDNNDREWFHAHPAEWKRAQAQYHALAEQLIAGIGEFDPTIRGLAVKDCVYRIARDTRFSNDKTPYKNWLGIYIAPKGKKSGFAGYYFHIEPCGDGLIGHHLLTAGLYAPEPTVLKSVREEILDHGAELLQTIADTGFTFARNNSLKRTPVGFPSGSEFDDLLRLKDLYVEKTISEEFLFDPQLVPKTLAEFRRTQPFITQLNRAVQYAYDEMR